ncbi:MAG: 50S ribosomal protein L24 [Thermoplasmata archaeon HGW-Thermoplasmata-1]|nr:MAG: 50S ribosomal protein L24 [Thermoplasmata archaeon HGW-Thermoplasmata-1]
MALTKSIQPRKQRKAVYDAPLHVRRKLVASHLSEELLLRYNRRSIPVVKGDTVKVLRGDFKGHQNKVVGIDTKALRIAVEGVTVAKADGTKVAKPINPSNVIITRLDLTDAYRRGRLAEGLAADVKASMDAEAKKQLAEKEAERKATEEAARKAAEEAEAAENAAAETEDAAEDEAENENEEAAEEKEAE